LKPVLAPVSELLSFGEAKESIQRKGDSDAACFLRSVVFIGGCQKGLLSLWQRAASLAHPIGLFPIKTSALGAAYGMVNR